MLNIAKVPLKSSRVGLGYKSISGSKIAKIFILYSSCFENSYLLPHVMSRFLILITTGCYFRRHITEGEQCASSPHFKASKIQMPQYSLESCNFV